MHKTIGRKKLSPASIGSPCSYELMGEYIVGRFLGIIPIARIHLGAVHYLRLATRNETNPLYLLLNWPQFLMSSRRAVRPVYILQTRKGQRLFLKLEGGEHFRLRQAIARHNNPAIHRMAA